MDVDNTPDGLITQNTQIWFSFVKSNALSVLIIRCIRTEAFVRGLNTCFHGHIVGQEHTNFKSRIGKAVSFTDFTKPRRMPDKKSSLKCINGTAACFSTTRVHDTKTVKNITVHQLIFSPLFKHRNPHTRANMCFVIGIIRTSDQSDTWVYSHSGHSITFMNKFTGETDFLCMWKVSVFLYIVPSS